VRNYQRLGDRVFTTNLGAHNAVFGSIGRGRGGRPSPGSRQAGINDALLERSAGRWRSPAGGGAYARRVVDSFRSAAGRCAPCDPTFAIGWAALAPGLYGALLFQYYLTYVLALAGAILLARERRPLRGVWAILASYALLHAVVSDGNFRLAAPLYPLLCLFAGHAVAWLFARRQPVRLTPPGARA
jgi:hypothetical protein